MSKCTLIIDGNFFVISRLMVLPKPKSTIEVDGKKIPCKLLDDKRQMQSFIEKLAMDFACEIRKFKNIVNRVVFVIDSKSWRKDYDSSYKSNRTFSDTINWKNVSTILNDFEIILNDKGIITERVPGAEGDDLIFAWSTYLNSIGEDCIMWTGDKDLLQLVNYNKSTESFSLWYDNTKNRMGVYPGFDKWLEYNDVNNNIDIFNLEEDSLLGSNKKENIKDLINHSKLKIEKTFCDEFAFIKILKGDKGDNISSLILKPSKKGNTFFKISDKKALDILTLFKNKNKRFSSNYFFDKSYKDEIIKYAKEIMNVKIPDSELIEKLEKNINLMLLHVETIPDAIQQSMFNVIKNDYNIKINNFDSLSSNKYILENTKYSIKQPLNKTNFNNSLF